MITTAIIENQIITAVIEPEKMFTTVITGDLTLLSQNAGTYIYTQIGAASVWYITHNLGKYPSVTIVDSGDNVVYGDLIYSSADSLTAKFSAPFSGRAYLN